MLVTLGLGANLGDRLATLQRAVDGLAGLGVRVVASSRVWETAPVGGPPDQPPYLNAVVVAEADGPAEALAAGRRVEADLGRTREVRWGPRTIDIDVLLADGVVSDEPELTIPHPRLTERAFVVLPLLELDPDPTIPGRGRLLDLPAPDGDARPYAAPLATPSMRARSA
jgi:2-amino-4-hydroxy-6-hydroxymethyldihydropteridine diphosphokinase